MDFQPGINFQSLEEFLDYLPEKQLQITLLLRELIRETVPEAKEKLSFNVPFFRRHYSLCHIWPAAIPWGKVKGEGVSFGFSKGYLMEDPDGFLEKGNRKYIYTHLFHEVEEIDPEQIRTYLLEAVAVDDRVKAAKKSNKSR